MTNVATIAAHKMHIGGHAIDAVDGETITTVNPATGEPLATFPAGKPADVDLAVAAAKAASVGWRDAEATTRARLISALATAIDEHAEELARLDSAENGSLLSEMRRDAVGAAGALRYFAGLALQVRGTTLPPTAGALTYTTRMPYGVVGQIVPFNHPLLFAAGKIAAPLVAGNTIVLKPSECTSLSALRLAELAADILPDGVLNVVTGWGMDVGDALVGHPDVHRVAFTGSVGTGLAIQRRAAQSSVKTVTLELGGKNPLVVFPDASLDEVVDAAVRGMNFTWQGQSCGSLSRNIVHESIYDEFVERLTARVAALRPGLPDDPSSQTGAIIHQAQLDKVLSYVQLGLDEGARLCTGGTRVTEGVLGKGLFLRPAVFADVAVDSRLAQEEIFGPVLSVLKFGTEDEAIRMANATQFGLAASVFTSDLGIAHRFAHAVDAGYVWVNEVSKHIHGTPYGGVKNSGVGREEDIDELMSFTQSKTVHIKFPAQG